jgi:hypothetical protein
MRISTIDVFCKKQCELMSENFEPYYFDTIHLTLTGADLLKDRFKFFINTKLLNR